MSKQSDRDESSWAAQDDLTSYDDLVRALQAPGSDEELADEPRFRAAFRETRGELAAVVPMSSRMARRLGAGGTAVIVVVALSSGGVAAALTGNLPDPVQEFAHSVLGAPEPEAPAAKRVAAPEIKPVPEEAATESPDSAPSIPTASSDAEEPQPGNPGKSAPTSATESSPGKPANPEESRGPADEPTRGSKPPVVSSPIPASLTMSGGSHLTPYGGTLILAGRVVAADGTPIAGRKVVLQVRGPGRWERVLRTRSDSAGVVTASTAPVTGLDRYRWRVRAPLRSAVWRVRVKPTVSASYSVSGDQTSVTASTVGARRGDLVSVYARVKKQPTLVGEVRVGADGTAQFNLPTPTRRRALVIRLERTRDHAPARTRLNITPLGRPTTP